MRGPHEQAEEREMWNVKHSSPVNAETVNSLNQQLSTVDWNNEGVEGVPLLNLCVKLPRGRDAELLTCTPSCNNEMFFKHA